MILSERKLDNGDVIRIEKLSKKLLQVNITDTVGVVVFAKHTEDGHEALELFYHPYGDRRVDHGNLSLVEAKG